MKSQLKISSYKIFGLSVIIGALGTAGYWLLKDKSKKVIQQFEKITFFPSNIKNIVTAWSNGNPFLRMNVDLTFQNPTPENFEASGGLIYLKKLIVFDRSGNKIGEATPQINALNIASYATTTIKNIPTTLDLKGSMILVLEIIKNKKIPQNFKFEAIIEVLGIEYKITQS